MSCHLVQREKIEHQRYHSKSGVLTIIQKALCERTSFDTEKMFIDVQMCHSRSL